MSPRAQWLRGLSRRLPPGPAGLRRAAGVEGAVRSLLLGGLMPLWIGAGLADWYPHRRTRIEDTAGARESDRHSLMFAETGVPVLLGLFCEVNAGVLATAADAVTVFGVLPYAEELLRCWRASRTLSPLPEPAESATGTLRAPGRDQAGVPRRG